MVIKIIYLLEKKNQIIHLHLLVIEKKKGKEIVVNIIHIEVVIVIMKTIKIITKR